MSEIEQEKRATFSSSGRVKEKETKIRVMGSAKIIGGKIEKFVKTTGSVKIEDNLECNGFKAVGSTSGGGSIISHGFVKSSGSFSIAGSLQVTEKARFFGSVNIGKKVELGGELKVFGSIRTKNAVETGSKITIFGSGNIGGDILTENNVKVKGSLSASGNIYANNITLGRKRWWNIFGIKHGSDRPYRISGSIIGTNKVNIRGTVVEKDVKGQNVRIGKYSKVKGQIYYSKSIKIHRKAKIKGEPIRISE